MGKHAAALALLFVAAIGLSAEGRKLSLNWAFAKRAPDGAARPIDFSDRVNIKSGDLFKLFIQPEASSYVYLVLQDSSDEVQLLFPESFELFGMADYAKRRYFLPEGNDWFTLDGAKGTERFYLIASSERLRPLESLIAAHQAKASAKDSTAAAKNAARRAVLDEIKRLINEHSRLAAASEKPVSIAGGSRGVNEEVEKLATRIEASEFYAKTFRLEH
jgi:hypothetical protein